MVLVLCFIFVESLMKIFQRVFELLRGHEIMTDSQTDNQTDRQTV